MKYPDYSMIGGIVSSPDETEAEPRGQTVARLDDVGLAILGVLRQEGRISMAALAERVGVSRANVYTRVGTLIEEGVITGFSARVDPKKVGLGICSLVFVSVYPQTWNSFRARVIQMTEVESCRVTTGQHDAMLVVRAADVGAIHDFVIGEVAALPEVTSVETVLVLDEVFERPYLLPSDLEPRGHSDLGSGLMRFTRADPGRTAL